MSTTVQVSKARAVRRSVFDKPIWAKTKAEIIDDLQDMLADTWEGFAVFLVGAFIIGLMAQVGAFAVSKPGLVEWIAYNVFYQNCLVNGVCDFNANMTAFTVTNVVGVGLATLMVLLFYAMRRTPAELTDEALDRIENTVTQAVARINDLEDKLDATLADKAN